jgi:hypothetical protein
LSIARYVGSEPVMEDWKKKSYVVDTEEAGRIILMPYELEVSKADVEKIAFSNEPSNVESLQFLFLNEYPDQVIKVETYPLTIPQDAKMIEELQVGKYGRDVSVGRTGYQPIYATRGLIGDTYFYIEHYFPSISRGEVNHIVQSIKTFKEA